MGWGSEVDEEDEGAIEEKVVRLLMLLMGIAILRVVMSVREVQ